jgi:hypothetical protein
MTNFSKSASSPISEAIKLVKSIESSFDDYSKLTSDRAHNIGIALEQAGIAIENICICLKQHEERIKELEGK